MPELRRYYLFISHAWQYDTDYYGLINLLDNAPYFSYWNYSVPTHDPLVDPSTLVGQNKLFSLLEAQIRPCQCVLVIAGMYAAHRYWMDKEVAIAQSFGKPIIAVRPRGQERVPLSVQFAASDMVYWNTDSIVSAIRHWSL